MLTRDGAAHRRPRGTANPLFTAKAINETASRIAGIIHRIMDDMGKGRDFDLIGSLAALVPVTVFCGLGGLPVEDRDLCRKWTDALGHVIDPAVDETTRRAMNDAAEEFGADIAGHVEQRRVAPRNDFLSRLLLAEFDGEKLSDEEIIANVMMFFLGGHETTANLIGNGMPALLRRPDVRPLSLGGGPHHCIGAALAKAGAKPVFTELPRRHRDIRPSREGVVWRSQVNKRGLSELRVDLVS
ncbi:cytochrome P450 [Streptomyces sp. LaBMicrA B280]|uniref:cytochrome P450 n=1 Tax=Streptomyces sp. LaBMicrA B280 TaxID=3391001 RepID=UPI003BA4DB99